MPTDAAPNGREWGTYYIYDIYNTNRSCKYTTSSSLEAKALQVHAYADLFMKSYILYTIQGINTNQKTKEKRKKL